jgi:hypothetical protein
MRGRSNARAPWCDRNAGVDLPPSVARLLVEHPALGRLATRTSQALILGRIRAVGMPETATCAEVLRSHGKRKMVAKAVYEELVGMDESARRIHGHLNTRPVTERFPGGYREVEPLVEAVCREPDAKPYAATLWQIHQELKQ